MRLLAIDTSTPEGSVAALKDDKPMKVWAGSAGENYSTRLFRWLEEAIDYLNGFSALEAILVSSGPGAFTGLRIGVAAAKGIALATDCALFALPTLQLIAWSVRQEGMKHIRPIVNAGRGELYTAKYAHSDSELLALENPSLIKPDNVLPLLDGDTVSCGNGISLLGDQLDNCDAKIVKNVQPLAQSAIEIFLTNESEYTDKQLKTQIDILYVRGPV